MAADSVRSGSLALEDYTFLTRQVSQQNAPIFGVVHSQILKGFSNTSEKPDGLTVDKSDDHSFAGVVGIAVRALTTVHGVVNHVLLEIWIRLAGMTANRGLVLCPAPLSFVHSRLMPEGEFDPIADTYLVVDHDEIVSNNMLADPELSCDLVIL
ncbi:MAG TPA: hypothetical protein VFV92_03405 [Candidatus Bathyarchaeia archaeon]|nr:hypothetical protein [Candidatus Bathyarchaeia archaeon]